MGDLDHSRTFFQHLQAVTPADVRRALKQYLVGARETSVSLNPASAATAPAAAVAVAVVAGAASVAYMTATTALAAGAGHACAIRSGTIRCVGGNGSGQLGNGSRAATKVPVAGQGIADVLRLAAGVDHICALRSGGRVMCWGSNQRGQLGDGTTAESLAPIAVLDIP